MWALLYAHEHIYRGVHAPVTFSRSSKWLVCLARSCECTKLGGRMGKVVLVMSWKRWLSGSCSAAFTKRLTAAIDIAALLSASCAPCMSRGDSISMRRRIAGLRSDKHH